MHVLLRLRDRNIRMNSVTFINNIDVGYTFLWCKIIQKLKILFTYYSVRIYKNQLPCCGYCKCGFANHMLLLFTHLLVLHAVLPFKKLHVRHKRISFRYKGKKQHEYFSTINMSWYIHDQMV